MHCFLYACLVPPWGTKQFISETVYHIHVTWLSHWDRIYIPEIKNSCLLTLLLKEGLSNHCLKPQTYTSKITNEPIYKMTADRFWGSVDIHVGYEKWRVYYICIFISKRQIKCDCNWTTWICGLFYCTPIKDLGAWQQWRLKQYFITEFPLFIHLHRSGIVLNRMIIPCINVNCVAYVSYHESNFNMRLARHQVYMHNAGTSITASSSN